MLWSYLDWWDDERRRNLVAMQRGIDEAYLAMFAHHAPKQLRAEQLQQDRRVRRRPPWVDGRGGLTTRELDAAHEIIRRMRSQTAREIPVN